MGYSDKTIDFARVQEALANDPQGLLDALGLNYRREGAYAYVQDGPASGSNSFCVFLTNGTYKDFASNRPKGDMIDLIGHVFGYRNQLEALKWARGYLGWGELVAGQVSAAELARRDAEARKRKAKEAEDAAAKSQRLYKFWLAQPTGAGTVVETYLRQARRIPLDRLTAFPGAIRFQPVAEHTDKETGEVTEWPAMLCLVQDINGALGIHRTYLRPDGSAKAPVKPAKMMHGTIKGGYVAISRGAGHRRPKDALARFQKHGERGKLLIGEGIETTATVACAVPDYRAWAALSLSNMALDWPAFVSEVVLLRENDQKRPAVEAFQRVEAHWRDLAAKNNGQVRVIAPLMGNDFNDWIRG